MKIRRDSFIVKRACLGLYFVTPVLLHPLGMHSQNLYSPGLHFQGDTYSETSMLTLKVVACVIPQAWSLKKTYLLPC